MGMECGAIAFGICWGIWGIRNDALLRLTHPTLDLGLDLGLGLGLGGVMR